MNSASEFREDISDLRACYLGKAFLFDDFPISVVSIGRYPQSELCLIYLSVTNEIFHQARGLSETDRKDPCRNWVKSAGMPYALGSR